MSDPIADAAAQQQNDPSLLEKAMDTIHSLEAKVEHLMHPEAASEPQPVSVTIENKPSLESAPVATAEVVDPNAVPAADAGGQDPVGAFPAAGGEQAVNGIVGLVDPAASIRTHITNIKQHLSIRGFELSLVADIHAELAAIESHL